MSTVSLFRVLRDLRVITKDDYMDFRDLYIKEIMHSLEVYNG